MKWVAIAQVFRLSSFSLNLLNIHRLTPLYRVQTDRDHDTDLQLRLSSHRYAFDG